MGLFLMVGLALTAAGTGAGTDPVRPCSFQLSTAPPAQIVAPEDIAQRAWVMLQPDSPIAVVRVDLGGLRLNGGPSSFQRSGHYVVDVTNVSDQIITEAEVMIHVGFGQGSGVGAGHKVPSLNPGEQVRVEWKAGTGRGTTPMDAEPVIVTLVSSAKTRTCTYKPSQSWPSAQGQ
jgi:hypothetical protein